MRKGSAHELFQNMAESSTFVAFAAELRTRGHLEKYEKLIDGSACSRQPRRAASVKPADRKEGVRCVDKTEAPGEREADRSKPEILEIRSLGGRHCHSDLHQARNLLASNRNLMNRESQKERHSPRRPVVEEHGIGKTWVPAL